MVIKCYNTTAFGKTTTYHTNEIRCQFDEDSKELIERDAEPMLCFEADGRFMSVPAMLVIEIKEG